MDFDLSLLGVKKNIPKVNFTSYSGLFVAPPKFGKTTTASYFPNAIIVPFEDGTKGQVVNVVQNLKSWSDFIEFVDKLEENREAIGDNIETIVYDTVNKAWEMSEPYTLTRMSMADKKRYKKPSDIPHGGFYPERDKIFATQLERILNMGFSILFLTHSKVKTIRPKDGDPYDVYSSTMPDRLEAMINPLVDFMLYGERRLIDGEEKRVLVTKGTNMSNAGNRVRIEEDVVFESEEEAMEKYQVKFKESVIALLKKRGITQSYEEISEQQKKEKEEEVKSYIAETKKPTAEELLVVMDGHVANMDEEQTAELKKVLKEELKLMNYKKYDAEQLEQAIKISEKILSV